MLLQQVRGHRGRLALLRCSICSALLAAPLLVAVLQRAHALRVQVQAAAGRGPLDLHCAVRVWLCCICGRRVCHMRQAPSDSIHEGSQRRRGTSSLQHTRRGCRGRACRNCRNTAAVRGSRCSCKYTCCASGTCSPSWYSKWTVKGRAPGVAMVALPLCCMVCCAAPHAHSENGGCAAACLHRWRRGPQVSGHGMAERCRRMDAWRTPLSWRERQGLTAALPQTLGGASSTGTLARATSRARSWLRCELGLQICTSRYALCAPGLHQECSPRRKVSLRHRGGSRVARA